MKRIMFGVTAALAILLGTSGAALAGIHLY